MSLGIGHTKSLAGDWVSFWQKWVTGRGLARAAGGSVQLSEEQANTHGDVAIHLGLSRRVGMRCP